MGDFSLRPPGAFLYSGYANGWAAINAWKRWRRTGAKMALAGRGEGTLEANSVAFPAERASVDWSLVEIRELIGEQVELLDFSQ